MPNPLLAQQPLTAYLATPTIVGTNDGTILTDSSDATYVDLDSPSTGSDGIQIYLTPATPAAGPVVITATVSYVVNAPPVGGALQRLVWTVLANNGDLSWNVSSRFNLPANPGVLQTVSTDLSTITSGSGAMAAGFNAALFYSDLAAGRVYLRTFGQLPPGNTTMTLTRFGIETVDSPVTYRRIKPREDGRAGGAPRNFPPSKAVQSGNRTSGYF